MKNYLVMAGIALAVVVLAFLVVRPVSTTVEKIVPGTSLGAQSEKVSEENCTILGGLHSCTYQARFQQGTTTMCSLKLPNATTTVTHAVMRVDLATTTRKSYAEIGFGGGNTATTTSLGVMQLEAAEDGILDAATTTAALAARTNILPNMALNFNLAGSIEGSATGFVPTGVCSAQYFY